MSCILKNTKGCLNQNCNKAIEKVCGSFSTGLKVKTVGRQIFNIPHNKEGLDFLALCKKYLNTPRYRLVKRGRASNRPKYADCGYNSSPSLRVADSKWFAVYPSYKETKKEQERKKLENQRYIEQWNKKREVREAINSLEEKLIKAKEVLTTI